MGVSARVALAMLVAAAAVVIGAPIPAFAPERACATGELHVAIVVDFGGLASTTSTCVGAESRGNGAQLLATRASQLGTSAPRFNSGGLLCGIDGIPASGCGEQHGGKYAYWSYFHGSGGQWSYSDVGPASTRVHADVVEGWRWQPGGAGNPTDPAPRASATPNATCVPAPPPPTTMVHAAGPPPTAPAAPGLIAPDPTAVPLGGVIAGGTTVPSGTAKGAKPTQASTGTAVAGKNNPSDTTTVGDSALAATSASKHGAGDDGPPIGFIVGTLLVGGLATVGVVVARRRGKPAA